ncbi:hypothetical protein AgCh_018851 [Apium graveolens]
MEMDDEKALMELDLRNESMPLDECTDINIDESDNGGMNNEEGEVSDGDVVFSWEGSLANEKKTGMVEDGCTCGASQKMKSRLVTSDSEPGHTDNGVAEKKLGRRFQAAVSCRDWELAESLILFQAAVSCRDWELAESLILLADPQTLNDSLCISLNSVWFFTTEDELFGIKGVIKKSYCLWCL